MACAGNVITSSFQKTLSVCSTCSSKYQGKAGHKCAAIDARINKRSPKDGTITVSYFLEVTMTERPKILVTQKVPDPAYPLLEAIGDVEATTRLGIAVSNTPGVLSDTTADLAFALLMATARRIPEAERYLRAGKFKGWGPLLFCGEDVHGSVLGLLGAGRIGKIVARRASGFDMKVIYYDVYRMSPEEEVTYHVTYMPMEEVLRQADFISIHTP